MRVLSLFDGIACGYEALLRAGIKIDKYYASEIDKYAIQIAQKNHPDIIEIGDVTQVNGKDYEGIDLLIGGSPCQGFSVAGKQLNFNDPRSKLFFDYVRILQEAKPKYFLLENVKMKREFRDKISEIMGCEPILIDSALVSAQHRERYYWTNIPGIEQPKDKGILLKDVLQGRITQSEGLELTTAMGTGGGNVPAVAYAPGSREYAQQGWETDKSPTLAARNPIVSCVDGEVRVKQATKQGYIVAHEGDGIDLSYPNSSTRRGRVKSQKSNTLTVQGDDYVYTPIVGNQFNNRVFTDKAGTIGTGMGRTNKQGIGIYDGEISPSKFIRKLTPIECERLQTLPDNYTEGVSDTQRYKQLGNGWTVDVIAHIFNYIPKNNG